jgi:hypothetical protein
VPQDKGDTVSVHSWDMSEILAMLGSDATEPDAELMVAHLTERGYMPNTFDEIDDPDWEAGVAKIVAAGAGNDPPVPAVREPSPLTYSQFYNMDQFQDDDDDTCEHGRVNSDCDICAYDRMVDAADDRRKAAREMGE